MLKVVIPANQLWDEGREEFITIKEQTLQLEHSLLSLSKWEETWKKPFLKKESRTQEESNDYVRCMTITQNVDPSVYEYIPSDIMSQINDYILDDKTATTFSREDGAPNRSIYTSERIYHMMIALGIPFECQKWHLNRLITLIHVCNIENSPKKKLRGKDLAARNKSLNAKRRQSLNTSG